MMADMGGEDINPRHMEVNTSEENFELELDEFELGQKVCPKVGDSLIDYLTKMNEKKMNI